jgi:predicted TIM-barrel fold metal-dependent hydrolase
MAASDRRESMLLDTHQHLIAPTRLRYDWWRSTSGDGRTCGPHQYARATAGVPVSATLFVEGNVAEGLAFAEAQWASELAGHTGSLIVGVVAAVAPECADFAEQLARLRHLPMVRGVRRVLHSESVEFLLSDSFRSNLRLLAPTGLTFDLCVQAHQLAAARTLVAACSDVTFILDHCGLPPLAGPALVAWADDFSRLAALPNVACKFSGLLGRASTAVRDNPQAYVPVWNRMIDDFGWERVMWGSDWPLCDLVGTLAQWWRICDQLLAPATAEQRNAFLHTNACRLYRLS